ncbi:hypothetical protein ACFV0T_26595 [Streptomyces sp. NPDC059582]|uniref:hypothetical protein n=1 Tax=Streptomyces sp. NPDC059582 TaxID=3346875 RepID=UPI0036BAC6DD
MTTRIVTAAAALAAAVAVSLAVVRDRRLHRVLARERVQARLMDGCLHRDMDELHRRLEAVMAGQQADRAVVDVAALVVDGALAARTADLNRPNHARDWFDPYQEGGSS